MLSRRIFFRADGNAQIGMGHFIRTLALAEMLKDDFECIYAIQKPSEYQIKEIARVGIKRLDLPPNEKHFEVFKDSLKRNDIVVLDNYFFSTNYQISIKNLGCKLVCIDDLHDKHFVSDLIINHNEGIKEYQYSIENYTRLCLGFKYSLLRKEYLADSLNTKSKKYSCLIMIGGTDPFQIANKVIDIYISLKLFLPIAVITGSDFIEKEFSQKYNGIEIFKNVGSNIVFELMQSSKIGIFPASTVSIEACAVRLPFICGYFIENQIELYKTMYNNNLAICLGNFNNINSSILLKSFQQLSNDVNFETIKKNQAALLDKKSKCRIIKIFNTL